MTAQGPMAGLRVLDLSQYIAGPYCTKLLADYGAEVIKVEPPDNGDVARQVGPFPDDVSHPEKSGLFLHLNTNKMSVTLDLEKHDGRELLRQMVAETDVIVEDFGPDGLAGYGLPPESLQEINPQLVVTSIANFGTVGPYRDYKATDLVLYAMSSWMNAMGRPDCAPLYPGGPYILYVAGQYANVGTLLASTYAELNGVGQTVDVSMLESGLSVQVYDTVVHSYFGTQRQRDGHRWKGLTLSIQPAKDGYVNFTMGHGEERWQDLWSVLLDKPEVLEDPRFSVEERYKYMDELDILAQDALKNLTVDEVFHTGQALRMFFSPVPTLKEILESPQAAARGFFHEMVHPEAGSLTYSGPPARLKASPWSLRTPAPILGQHNQEIYEKRLGLSKKTLSTLQSKGVI